tara:strand:+ start:15300 stop:16286 length:987 start_codon:yes stop_codon:yes gene_type:complete
MIISRTPFRISYFGGGTDLPDWYNVNRGKTISTTINKYCYISVRELPPYFNFNYRLRYFKKENVKKIYQIKHPSIRETLKYLKFKKNLELVHNADIPAKSGLGASSSFTVGLLNALYNFNKTKLVKKKLALDAINIEQKKIGEYVGSQDQTATAVGGFNIINYRKNGIKIKNLSNYRNVKILEKSTALFFTGFQRNAQNIEKKKLKNIYKISKYLNEILNLTDEAENQIYNSKNILSNYSELMMKYWWLKKKLSNNVSNKLIDEIYKKGINAGANAGKLLGAGGGGFIMYLVDPLKKENLIKSMKKFIYLPIKFENSGTEIIYKDNNI